MKITVSHTVHSHRRPRQKHVLNIRLFQPPLPLGAWSRTVRTQDFRWRRTCVDTRFSVTGRCPAQHFLADGRKSFLCRTCSMLHGATSSKLHIQAEWVHRARISFESSLHFFTAVLPSYAHTHARYATAWPRWACGTLLVGASLCLPMLHPLVSSFCSTCFTDRE